MTEVQYTISARNKLELTEVQYTISARNNLEVPEVEYFISVRNKLEVAEVQYFISARNKLEVTEAAWNSGQFSPEERVPDRTSELQYGSVVPGNGLVTSKKKSQWTSGNQSPTLSVTHWDITFVSIHWMS
jgi:hypothetical protein